METIEKLKAGHFFQIKGNPKVNEIGKHKDEGKYGLGEIMLIKGNITPLTRGEAEFKDGVMVVSNLSNDVNIPYSDITFFDRENNEEEFKKLAGLPSNVWACR